MSSDVPSTLPSSSFKVMFSGAMVVSGENKFVHFCLNDKQKEFWRDVRNFESVSLDRASLEVVISAGSAGFITAGFCEREDYDQHEPEIDSDTQVAALPYSSTVACSPQSSSRTVVLLPEGHPYGTELKAISIGNPPPAAFLWVRGLPEGATVEVKAYARFYCTVRGRSLYL